MFKKLFSYLTWSRVRVVAEYIAVILLVAHLLPPSLLEKWKENGLAAIFFLGLCLILALLLNVLNARKFDAKIAMLKAQIGALEDQQLAQDETLAKNAAYTEIFRLLNEGFSGLHDGLSRLHDEIRSDLNQAELKGAFEKFCTKLSYAFEEITETDCHVCIKLIMGPASGQGRSSSYSKPKSYSKLKVRTFVRETIKGYRANIDSMNINHLLMNNSDYEYIIHNIKSEDGRYYLRNSLPGVPDYKNTSFPRLGDQENPRYFPESVPLEERRKVWPLQYRSCITVPICPGISLPEADKIIGFLCVDSVEEGVFNDKIDTEIMCGCADGLYNPLKMYIDKFYFR